MSSDKGGANPPHRKSEVSRARFVPRGQSAPKARPRGVADGELANIPAPGRLSQDRAGPEARALLDWRAAGRSAGATRREGARGARREKGPGLQASGPYRKPTQVDGSSRPRCAGETTSRNSAKPPRNFGRRGAPPSRATEAGGAAAKRPRRLFSKNTALCQIPR